jgi:hypothetical protein
MAQVVIGMFMEGNEILESFAKKEGCLFELLSYLVLLGKIQISGLKQKKTLHCCKVF